MIESHMTVPAYVLNARLGNHFRAPRLVTRGRHLQGCRRVRERRSPIAVLVRLLTSPQTAPLNETLTHGRPRQLQSARDNVFTQFYPVLREPLSQLAIRVVWTLQTFQPPFVRTYTSM
jgi:hypothetical protein